MISKTNSEKAVFMPFVDIYEQDSSFELYADLPGLDQNSLNDHLKVVVEDGILHIEANIDDGNAENKKAVTEFLRGKFKRSFKVSNKLDLENFSGSYKDGVLHITLPKHKNNHAVPITIKSA